MNFRVSNMYTDNLNRSNKKEIESFIEQPTQAILFIAPEKFGANRVADEVASKLSSHPVVLKPSKGSGNMLSISVDDIRWLYSITLHKSETKNIVVIHSAETMTRQAQNAFLKLLEEPTIQTHFIISCENISNVLPTVISRTRRVALSRISRKASASMLEKISIPDKNKEQILFLASGLPEEIYRLSSDTEYFNQRMLYVKDAMLLLTGNGYDRARLVHKYKEDRPAAIQMIDDCLSIIRNTIKSQDKTGAIHKLSALIDARESLESNSMVRLTLMDLVV